MRTPTLPEGTMSSHPNANELLKHDSGRLRIISIDTCVHVCVFSSTEAAGSTTYFFFVYVLRDPRKATRRNTTTGSSTAIVAQVLIVTGLAYVPSHEWICN